MVYDPACYYAHSEAEVGIMHMFGGFGPTFWHEYHKVSVSPLHATSPLSPTHSDSHTDRRHECSICSVCNSDTLFFLLCQHVPRAPGFERRLQLYELYHYLNHLNLFGSSYRSACLRIMRELAQE